MVVQVDPNGEALQSLVVRMQVQTMLGQGLCFAYHVQVKQVIYGILNFIGFVVRQTVACHVLTKMIEAFGFLFHAMKLSFLRVSVFHAGV